MHSSRTAHQGRILLVLIATALLAGRAAAHSEPPRPPKPGIAEATGQWVRPARWSWLHWWEANRDAYLLALRQGEEQQDDPDVVEGYRRKAVDALIAATGSQYFQARVAAALALGRIGDPAALPSLRTLAQEDPVETVRMAARVALGLLDTPGARALLVAGEHTTERQIMAAIVAYGLVEQTDPAAIAALQRSLNGSRVGPATMAAWALRCHHDPRTIGILAEVLDRTTSAWLASESLLMVGPTGRYGRPDVQGGAIRKLYHIVNETESGKQMAAWAELQRRHVEKLSYVNVPEMYKAKHEAKYEEYLKKLEDWNQRNPNAKMEPAPKTTGRKLHVTLGIEKIYQSRLRASAAIALGQIDHPDSTTALLEVLAADDDDYSDLYKGFVIMSLGQLGDPRALGPFKQVIVGPGDRRVQMSTKQLQSPLRGYAVLALGLYARPIETPQGKQDRPQYFAVCQFLAQRLADKRETPEVRAAAAMGLGLTGRTEVLKLLIPACSSIEANQELLTGYALLARAMVGDRGILAPAKRFLALANDRDDANGILARRAAVLAIGVLGRTEGIPILINSWELSYYVNREAAVAFSLCRAYNTTDTLAKMLANPTNALEQAFAAQCLGEVFTRIRPQRMARLIAGSNYTMKNLEMVNFQLLANEFLFEYLIRSFGTAWK